MKRALLIFLFFVAAQGLTQSVAFIIDHWDVIASAAAGSVDMSSLPLSPEMATSALVIGYPLLIAFLYATHLVRRSREWNVALAAVCPVRPLAPMAYVLAPIAFLFLALGMNFLLMPLALDDGGSMALFDSVKHNPLSLLLLCVVGPITEEVVFRAGFLQAFVRKGYPLWASIAISALAFGLVHLNLAQAVPAAILGVALALLYLRSGNLRLCVPAHVLNNTLGVVLMYFPAVDAFGTALPLAVQLLCGVTMVAVGGAALWRIVKQA